MTICVTACSYTPGICYVVALGHELVRCDSGYLRKTRLRDWRIRERTPWAVFSHHSSPPRYTTPPWHLCPHSSDRCAELELAPATLCGRLAPSLRAPINQSKVGPHKATHGQRRSHIPAPPQGAANPASRSDAGLGGCERVATALVRETHSFSTPFMSVACNKTDGQHLLKLKLAFTRSC